MAEQSNDSGAKGKDGEGVESPFGKLIYAYTRAMAIADGVLIDVSDRAKESGFKVPVAITEGAWNRYVAFDAEALAGQGQSETGRLIDVLHSAWIAAKRSCPDTSEIYFTFYVAMPDRGDWLATEAPPRPDSGFSRATHRLVALKALCGPGDGGEPVVTILLPDED